jgi:calcineurin-like phosphoesterase family protein
VSKISPWENFKPIIKNVELNLDLVSDTDLLFWSDTHFFHKNIIQYSDRPFMDVYDMNEQLVNNFNEVATHDTVSIWVGDVSFKEVIFTNELLDRCKGYKILVVGNHDFNRGKLQVYNFDEIHSIIQLNDYIITHHPWEKKPHGMKIIHGHTHNENTKYTKHINVSVEQQDYRPRTFKSIKEEMKERFNC